MPKFGLGFRARLRGGLGVVGQEIDLQNAAVQEWSETEHDIEGHHTNITAESISNSGAMEFGGPWTIPDASVLTPPIITANTDDYRPFGIESATDLRLETDAARDLTGIFNATTVYRRLTIFNIGNFALVLKHNTTSTAKFRFACPGGADVTLNSGDSVWLWYDKRAGNWRVMGL